MSRWSALLRGLVRIRLDRGPDAARRRRDLLSNLSRTTLPTAARNRATDLLLFIAAHPDDAGVYRLARRCLDRIARAKRDPIVYPFDLPMVRGLLAAGATVRFDREGMEEEKVEPLLPHLAGPAEDPALDDDEVGSWEWLDRATRRTTDAAWLVGRIDALPIPPRLRDHLYDGLGAQVVAEIPSAATRASAAWALARPFFHATPFLGRPRDVVKVVSEPIRATRLRGPAAVRMVALARNALAVRTREMFPIAHADPNDIVVFEPGRGLEVVLLGTLPERRLLLEGLWGFLLLKNAIPCGYGCVSVLWETAEIAWNVFPEFRGGESAWIYAQFLRVLRHHLGARAFYVEGYQIGRENEEAIRSGAYWFYRKMGFGPLSPRARARIRAEERRLVAWRVARGDSSRSGGRTPPARLRRLAQDDLFLILGPRPRPLFGRDRLARWGLRVTDHHARGGRRPTPEVENAPREISRAFSLLAETFPSPARRALGRLARAKGAASERGFVLAMNRLAKHFR